MSQTIESARPDLLLLQEYASTRNPSLFSELAARYTHSVYATCLRITSNPHDAEELTQDCFFELARQPHSIKSSVGGWLHRMATTRSLNTIRSRTRRSNHEQKSGEVRDLQTNEANWSDVAPILDEVIESLPNDLRETIVQHFLEGKSQSEIAEQLQLNQATVSRRVQKGLETLRKRLKSRGLTLSLASMTTLFLENSAEAASTQLVSSVAKIGLAGVGPKLVGFATLKLTTWCKLIASFAVPVVVELLVGGWIGFACGAVLLLYVSWCKPAWFQELLDAFGSSSVHFRKFNLLDRWNWSSPPANARHVMFVSLAIAVFAFCSAAIFLFASTYPSRFGMAAFFALIGAWRLAMAVRIGWHLRSVGPTETASTPEEKPRLGKINIVQSSLTTVCMVMMFAWAVTMNHATDIPYFGWWAVMLGVGVVWGLAEITYQFYVYRNQPAATEVSPAPAPAVIRAAHRASKVLMGFSGFMLAMAGLMIVATWNQPGNASDMLPGLGFLGSLSFGILSAALQPLYKLWRAKQLSRTLGAAIGINLVGCLALYVYWLALVWG